MMNIELIRKYCLKKKAVSESFPFGENTPVYKVAGKIFLIANITTPASINLKCDPEKASELREEFDAVTPGYHMNKLHWNTVLLENSIPDTIILNWINDSYNLVVEGLPKKDKIIILDK
jgi:predicted DNA-binding protein (MmcQ/YjbR family)